MGFNIAIDGPAGAGKSTIARRVAKELGFIYVDTGAMYRAVALGLLEKGENLDDPAALEAALAEIDVGIRYENGEQQMLLNGENVTEKIRTPRVSQMTSIFSAKPEVRAKLLGLQRSLAASADVLMDGRDIGTKILPEAELKIYLTASISARARRRYLEMTEKGEACSLEEIEEQIRERDNRDMNREEAPLKQAEDAVLVDSSDMTIEEVVEHIVSLTGTKRNEP